MCPFIDKANTRCADHMTFRNIANAFAHCANRYTACQVYQKLSARQFAHDKVRSARGLLAAS